MSWPLVILCYSTTMKNRSYIVLEKQVGETPLSCMETWRATQSPALTDTPLAYAGRLDPLASGKLLVLIGDECKKQANYHGLDKQYEFSVLFGVGSDTGDVMGRIETTSHPLSPSANTLKRAAHALIGNITLPYPAFSSKTVSGKPLHTWSMEGKIGEITIPTYTATIFSLKLKKLEQKSRSLIYSEALTKINSIPPVTELRKALGNDFRREDIRADWAKFSQTGRSNDQFTIATFSCIGSAGLYMRTLASEIGKAVNQDVTTPTLAYYIHRTKIGTYQPLPFGYGFWRKTY
jgi:tRNA pseudouridine(55) synthase